MKKDEFTFVAFRVLIRNSFGEFLLALLIAFVTIVMFGNVGLALNVGLGILFGSLLLLYFLHCNLKEAEEAIRKENAEKNG